MAGLVYFSSRSENTARLVERLALPAMRIPISGDTPPCPTGPYVMICPTYADAEGRGAVPKQVIKFLNDSARRSLIRGVISGGNRNFGATFALAGDIIARKCQVPVLYRFELAGTETDIARIREGLNKFWGMECSIPA